MLKTGGTKHCCWGLCNSDSRYPERLQEGTFFLPFPKPRRIKDGMTRLERDQAKPKTEKAKRWQFLCGRSDVDKVKQINKDTYICSKHFVGGRGPMSENDEPMLATLSDKESQIRRRNAPMKYGDQTAEYKPKGGRERLHEEDSSLGWTCLDSWVSDTEQINKNATHCSDQFISGKASDDIDSPDFVPAIFPISTRDDGDAGLKRRPTTSKEQQQQPESSAPDSAADSYHRFYVETWALDHNYSVIASAAARANLLAKENEALRQKKLELQHQLEELQLRNRFCVQRLAGSDEDICFYTRFASYRHLETFWRLVEPAVKTMMVQRTRAESSASSPEFSPQATKLPPFDELLLFLMYLSVGLPVRDIAERFGIHTSTASRIIDTWTHFLFALLGSECLWIPPDVVKANLPPEFSAFPDTRVVLDCVEISCQTPSSLFLQSEAFPTYKSQSLKAMIGMAPHGAITFVSRLYAGSVTDREVFKLSGITQLLTPDMAIMVDRGLVVDGLAPCKVYQPAFFSRNSEMSRKDVRETHVIAHLRVHLERCMGRVKENKLFDSDIPLSVCGSISELFSVACYLVNYQY